MRTSFLVRQLAGAIERASDMQSTLPADVLAIDGMSSPRVRILLNEVCKFVGARYLEVGCWKGSTLVSALHGNEAYVDRAVAIDDFSQFNFPPHDPRGDLKANIERHLARHMGRLSFHEGGCFELVPSLVSQGPFNVYFFDGPHDEAYQHRAFTEFAPMLADRMIAIVDDYNYPEAQRGTASGLAAAGYKVVYAEHLEADYGCDLRKWWNGLYVTVVEKQHG